MGGDDVEAKARLAEQLWKEAKAMN